MSKNLEVVQAMLEKIESIPQDVLAQAAKLGTMVDALEGVSVAIVFSNTQTIDTPVPLMFGGASPEAQLPLVLGNLLQAAEQRGIGIQLMAAQTETGDCDCPRCRAKRAAETEKVLH